MNEERAPRMKDYEWASIARWLSALEQFLSLKQIKWSAAMSFPYDRLGPIKLIAQKRRILAHVLENQDALEHYVKELCNDLEDAELCAIRSMYKQYVEVNKVLRDHISRAEQLQDMMRPLSINQKSEKEKKDEIPF